MSQISMPMRILLIGAAVFLVAWFTVLKPGGAEKELPPVQPANTEQPATTAATAATPGASETTENTPVAAVAVPADVLAELPKGVAGALKERKTIVLGVFSDDASDVRPMADDDRYVRNALKKTNRYDGEVYRKHISLSQLSAYGPLVNDLDVNQSPAVVVIDRNLKGTVLTGYVDRVSINQAIADARRDSIVPAIADAYLEWANETCANYKVRTSRWSRPTVRGARAQLKAVRRLHTSIATYTRAIERKPAPAKYKRFKAAFVADAKMRERLYGRAVKERAYSDAKFGALVADVIDDDVAATVDRHFNELGLTTCAANRRS